MKPWPFPYPTSCTHRRRFIRDEVKMICVCTVPRHHVNSVCHDKSLTSFHFIINTESYWSMSVWKKNRNQFTWTLHSCFKTPANTSFISIRQVLRCRRTQEEHHNTKPLEMFYSRNEECLKHSQNQRCLVFVLDVCQCVCVHSHLYI